MMVDPPATAGGTDRIQVPTPEFGVMVLAGNFNWPA
jgi:hypothetical protein